MDFIRGEDRSQLILLPDSVEEYVYDNNPVRVIDAYINSLNLKDLGFSKSELNETGRPPYDPKDLLKLYVYGYMNRIRSSRRLETESKRNLELIWLLGKLSPDFKTICRFRETNPEALKNVFREFVKLCARLGLYGKELIAIDSCKFKAVNSRSRNFTQKQLEGIVAESSGKIDRYMSELEQNDALEKAYSGEKSVEEITHIVACLTERKEQYEGYVKGLRETGEKQKSLTDPESRLMHSNGKKDVCYNVQTAVDAKNKMIVEFEVSNQCNDKNFITPMAVKTQQLLETENISAVADAGYESIQDILSAMSHGVDVHVAGTNFDICLPADDVEQTDISTHKDGRCVYIAERNISLCPMGKVLYPTSIKKNKGRMVGVYYNYEACQQCMCKCTKDARGRFCHLVPMEKKDFSKEYNDKNLIVKQIRIAAKKEVIRQRKSIVEHPFGTIKRGMEAGCCLTKGLRNVNGEFSLTFLAYNLKRAINILGCKKLISGMA